MNRVFATLNTLEERFADLPAIVEFVILCTVVGGVVLLIIWAAMTVPDMMRNRGSIVVTVPAVVVKHMQQEEYTTREWTGIAGRGGHYTTVQHPREWVLVLKAEGFDHTDQNVGCGVWYGANDGDTVMMTVRQWPKRNTFSVIKVALR